jgi:squalene-hopene/tetraprenyl-beta-curcumene cyclase
MPKAGPAITAMVVKGLLQAGKPADDPAIQKALAFIEKCHQPDGGFYVDSNVTYNTSIVLSTLALLPREKYKGQIEQAQNFLKSIQSGAAGSAKDDKGNTVDAKHPWYGGWGYAGKGARRPDLSNTHFVVEALRDSGVPASDPSIQNALVFVSRLQASEGNDQPWAKGQTNGGMIYSLRWNDKLNYYGESFAPNDKDRDGNEILATYGSMTYAGLKSFLYADLKKDDPRVKAVLRWVAGNWTLEENPGMGSKQGLFYYYDTFATGLNAYGEDTITDAKGVKHDWRTEYEAKMAKIQNADGSFANTEKDRWMENVPVLATTYVVLGLQQARGK